MISDGHRLVDRLRAWWIDKLESDSVRPWVPMYCAAWLIWALLATFLFPPVSTIEQAMGSEAYWLWVWMAIPGNIGPIIGLQMRHGGSALQSISTPLLLRDWMGLFFQAGGHAICCLLLIQFEISVIIAAATYEGPAAYAGMTIFAGVMLSPWTGGTFILCAQTLRKLQKGLRLERGAP